MYGPKGSGKSALFALLQEKNAELFNEGVLLTSGENPRGTTVFSGLVNDPPTTETEFVNLWKLYLLSLVGGLVKEYVGGSKEAKQLVSKLEDAKLMPGLGGLKGLLRSVLRYVRPSELKVDGGLDENSGMPKISGSIVFTEPDEEERRRGAVHVDELFALAEQAIEGADARVWILLDRLDVAFAESAEFEANALRALFKVYLDLLTYDRVRLKIFLRSDIWARIVQGKGFREASHITKHTTIKWDKSSLLNLIVRRAVQSKEVLEYVGMSEAEALSALKQDEFVNKLFPDQVDAGANRSRTIDWILNRVTDASGQTAPRELIHFLNTMRAEAVRGIELGTDEALAATLFSRQSIKGALPEVSKVRLQQTLYAEFPELREFIAQLEREKSTQSKGTLAKIWRLEVEKAFHVAEQLVEIGFFEKLGEKEDPTYRVPFLYRPALDLVQGSAD